MASLKDKYLESAQKFIIKGQYDRAIKDYREIIAIDSDIRHRQRLAELLVKGGYRDEAITEYETIAKYYENNHFYVKAIAVQKQVQKLDPTNITISLSLAELNYKQGLIGNCLAEYKTVHDYYESNGNVIDAVRILEAMLAVDPENLNIQLKLAESRFTAGAKEESYELFKNLAGVLKKRGDSGLLDQITERMNKLFPDRAVDRFDFLAEKLKSGDAAAAVAGLREMVEAEPEVRVFTMLLDASRMAGDLDTFRESCFGMIEHFPDELTPRTELVNLAIEEGNTVEAVRLLSIWAADFARLNAAPLFHDFCMSVGALAADNRQLLQQIAVLDPTFQLPPDDRPVTVPDKVPAAFPEASGELPVFDMEMAGESPFASESVDVLPSEDQWEEDIDLSLPDEEDLDEGIGVVLQERVPEIDLIDSDEILSTEAGEEQPEAEEEVLYVDDLPASEMVDVVLTAEDLARQDWHVESIEVSEEIIPVEDIPQEPLTVTHEEETFELISADEAADLFGAFDLVPEDLVVHKSEDEGTHSKYSFDGLFTEFKKSLDSQVERGDTETHFNLGIAYKEMGLYDDAIEEFNVSTADPGRRVDSISLQGACYKEKGDFDAAERVLTDGALTSEPGSESFCILMYELGSLFESAGKSDAALEVFEKVKAANPVFRDVLERISLLKGEEEALDLDDSELLEDL